MLKINALARIGRSPLRIDWFGDVTYFAPRGGSQARINVVLSTRIGNSKPTFEIALPATFLNSLRIGDLWSGGVRVGNSDTSSREVFVGLSVSDLNVRIVPIGLPLDPTQGDAYPLPFAAIDSHRLHTGSFCARVKVSDDILVVVPCVELMRFYFSTSGLLISRLLSGAQGADGLYSNPTFNPNTRGASLDLGKDIPGVAASTIGRIAFDNKARSAARWIVNSGISASANKLRYYPKTTFPFTGKTDLTADGVWIGHDHLNVFLVERLVQCTHPFPFSYLQYTTQMDVKEVDSKPLRWNSFPRLKDNSQPTGDVLCIEDFVSPSLLRKGVIFQREEVPPFPDLANKRIRKVADDNFGGHPRRPTNNPLEPLAVGVPNASSDIRGAEIVSEAFEEPTDEPEKPVEPDAVTVFKAAFRSLADNGLINARLAAPPSGNSHRLTPGFHFSGSLIKSQWDKPDIWLAQIQFHGHDTNRSLLVLAKGEINKDVPIHIALVRYVRTAESEVSALITLSVSFAHNRLVNDGQSFVAGALNTIQSTDSDEVLRFLKRVVTFETEQVSEWKSYSEAALRKLHIPVRAEFKEARLK